ncbi:MAG: hypothetical protein Q4F49_05630 [Pseudoxanthomonas suwonensis]|nr:hypothetical protein [Pseudoxanthomonas suwonensis]
MHLRRLGAGPLAGSVTYPSEYIPAMRICAVAVGDYGTGYCIDKPRDAADWRLPVPPGRWWLWAWPEDGSGVPGRHSQASDCIADGRHGCDDHAMRVLEVGAGETRGGVQINDWYADPEDGINPEPPRGEPLPDH